MKEAPLHPREDERIAELEALGALDSAPEAFFDHLVELAGQICGTPVSLVSLVDVHRQWFKAKRGTDASETPRSVAFCAHAILTPDEPFIVEDATLDDRFRDNPLVASDPRVRFYAGMPLVTSAGLPVGTLCVIDQIPHSLSQEQLRSLRTLAAAVVSGLELRRKEREANEAAVALGESRKRILQQQDQLQAAAKYSALGELAGGIAHEINNPLTIALGKSRMLREHLAAGGETAKAIAIAESTDPVLMRIAEIVRTMRLFARDEAKAEMRDHDLLTVVGDTLRLCNDRLVRTGAKVEVGGASRKAALRMNDIQMMQVFLNLVSNALDAVSAHDGDRWIKVEVEDGENMCQVRVANSGPRIPDEVAKSLFEPFFTTKAAGKGTGLGLSICRKIMTAHDGSIAVDLSRPYPCFVLTFLKGRFARVA